MNQSPTPDVSALFASAQNDGVLSAAAVQALHIPDLGAQIQAGLGINVDDVTATEVVLVTFLVDDSASIRMAGNAQPVRDGHNSMIDALSTTKQRDSVLMGTRYLNGTVLNPYNTLDAVQRLDSHNYNPSLGTPLYRETVVTLGTVVAKAQEFADNGVPVRSITCVISDGADSTGSYPTDAKAVWAIARDMLRQENHIIAAMGVDDGTTDFRQVFQEMGIPDQWILTPGNQPAEIRRAFQVMSQSAVRASQSAGWFNQAAAGGFGTT